MGAGGSACSRPDHKALELSRVLATLEPLARNVRRRMKENLRKRKTVLVESRVSVELGCAGEYGKNMLLTVANKLF